MTTGNNRSRSNAVNWTSDPRLAPVQQGRSRGHVVTSRPMPSLEKLMEDGFFFAAFLSFATQEFSGENLEFWRDVQQFRKLGFPTVLNARVIYSKYVAAGSQHEINIRNATRDDIKRKLGQLQGIYESNFSDRHALAGVFDDAMVENMMTLSDTYSRRIFSDGYARCMKQLGYTV